MNLSEYAKAKMLAGGNRARDMFRAKRIANIETYNLSPKLCLHCKTALPYDKRYNKFCSHRCAGNSSNGRHHANVYCIVCKKKLTHYNRKNKTCGQVCYQQYKLTLLVQDIENYHKVVSDKRYKRYLIFKYGAKCMKCGWQEMHPITKKVPIQLSHIDGNSENRTLTNMELLCPNCHSLTPSFGGLNRGKGRKIRRLRYKTNAELVQLDQNATLVQLR